MPDDYKQGSFPITITHAGRQFTIGTVNWELLGHTTCAACGFDSMCQMYLGMGIRSWCVRCDDDPWH